MFQEIFFDVINDLYNGVKNNVFNFIKIWDCVIPYFMFFAGLQTEKNTIPFFCFLVVPVFSFAVSSFLKKIANRSGTGIEIPRPVKRFTDCSRGGQVDVEYARMQELILFMGDFEDWLKKQGLTKE